MNIQKYGQVFGDSIRFTAPANREGTPLYHAAQEILEMAHAYAADGRVFFEKGDLVNALASFAYGAGWRDTGITIGYLPGDHVDPALPSFDDPIPAPLSGHLTEKTIRYRTMLRKAQAAVVPAADTESPLRTAGEGIIACAKRHLEHGEAILASGDQMNALASFSYGYGWLDAGVRAGLLQIVRERNLFTV
jgi:hypothetical protein